MKRATVVQSSHTGRVGIVNRALPWPFSNPTSALHISSRVQPNPTLHNATNRKTTDGQAARYLDQLYRTELTGSNGNILGPFPLGAVMGN